MSMRIVFMGTPDIAANVLEAITKTEHEVVLVVTNEDKPKGRGKELAESDVKKCAKAHGLKVFQPAKLKCPESVEVLKQTNADLFVVVAYGKILSREILDIPRLGCVNVHASLLPKYRGAAPIQWAVIDGEKETGITIMQMDEGLDTGDILFQRTVKIDEKETGGSLFDKLAECGASLMVDSLDKIERGEINPIKQEHELSNYARMLTKTLGFIDFSRGAVEIERLIRGLNPWPSTYTMLNGKTLKIWSADVSTEESNGPVGTVSKVGSDSFYVNTGNKLLEIKEVQLEGKKRMSAHDFLLGCKITEGILLGE